LLKNQETKESHQMNLTGNWSYPTSIKFGAGRIAELADACQAAGMKKPLLVTDKGLAILPITTQTLALMDSNDLGSAMFSEVDPNPNEKNLTAGVAAYKAGGHDGVIAFGGGSGLDLGKMVAFMAGQNRPVWDYEDVGANNGRNGFRSRPRKRHYQQRNPRKKDNLPP
jgi:alcohol dehydrogenase class IV